MQNNVHNQHEWYHTSDSSLYRYYAPAFENGPNLERGLEWFIYLGSYSGYVDIVLTAHEKSIQRVASTTVDLNLSLEEMLAAALNYAETILGSAITLPVVKDFTVKVPEAEAEGEAEGGATLHDIYLFLDMPWPKQWWILNSLSLLEESEEDCLWEERVRAAFKRARQRGCVDQLITAIKVENHHDWR